MNRGDNVYLSPYSSLYDGKDTKYKIVQVFNDKKGCIIRELDEKGRVIGNTILCEIRDLSKLKQMRF